MDWNKAQDWEKEWWSNCINTFGEEEKQLIYAEKMGLQRFHNGKSPYNFDLQGKSVLDIGGGATSLLLKCVNFSGCVIDPFPMPKWVLERYKEAGIQFSNNPAEKKPVKEVLADECWIYNCLQHTKNPEEIIKNAGKWGKLIRIFEWIDTPTNIGHPHSLSEAKLNEWLGGEGAVEELNLPTLRGRCYYGIFPV